MSASILVVITPNKINLDNVSALIRLTDIKPSTNDLPQIKVVAQCDLEMCFSVLADQKGVPAKLGSGFISIFHFYC